MVEQQEIGLNSLREDGLVTLGTNEMTVAFNSLRSLPVSKKYLMPEMISSPIEFQARLKKCPLNPSASGALWGCKLIKAAEISSLVTS